MIKSLKGKFVLISITILVSILIVSLLLSICVLSIMNNLFYKREIALTSYGCEKLFNCPPEDFNEYTIDLFKNTKDFKQNVYVDDQRNLWLTLSKSQYNKLYDFIVDTIYEKAGDNIVINSDFTNVTILGYYETVYNDVKISYDILEYIQILNILNHSSEEFSVEYILKDGITNKVMYSVNYPNTLIDIDVTVDTFHSSANKPFYDKLNETLLSNYNNYEIVDCFGVYKDDIFIESICIVKTNEFFDVLTIYSYNDEHEKLYVDKYATNIVSNIYYQVKSPVTQYYIGFVVCESENDVPENIYKTVELYTENSTWYFYIDYVETIPRN